MKSDITKRLDEIKTELKKIKNKYKFKRTFKLLLKDIFKKIKLKIRDTRTLGEKFSDTFWNSKGDEDRFKALVPILEEIQKIYIIFL